MASEWFYTRDRKSKTGPVSSAQLQALAKSGQLLSTDMVWKEGMAQWTPASKIKGLVPSTASDTGITAPPVPSMPTKTSARPSPNEPARQPAQVNHVARSVQIISRQPKVVIATGAALAAFFLLCGFCVVGSLFSRNQTEQKTAKLTRQFEAERKEAEREAKEDIAESARLWDSGNKSGAVEKYKAAIQRTTKAMTALPSDESTAYQRVIEYEFSHGNKSEAKRFIEDGANRHITLSFNDAKLQAFAAQTEKDFREREEVALAKLSDMNKKGDGKALDRQQAGKDLAEANHLWTRGEKANAVTKYKAIVQRGITLVGSGERPTVYQRIIEFEVEQGNISAARGFLEDALDRRIPLALIDPKAKEFASPIEREWQEKQVVALAKQKQKEEVALAKKKEDAKSKKAAKLQGIPDEQVRFIKVVESFYQPFKAAPNELKKSAIRGERKSAIANLNYPSNEVNDWVGTLRDMRTQSDGNAYISIALEGSKSILVRTWNNAISDISSGTLISNGSPLYNDISNLSKGTKVVFSGRFFPGGHALDQIKETSLTERGSMLDPEFLMKFSSVKKR